MRCYTIKFSGTEQIDYLNSALEEKVTDWANLKSKILNIQGILNDKNVDAVILKTIVRNRKIDLALSYLDYLKSSTPVLNIGVTNGILNLYYQKAKETPLIESEKEFILRTYEDLYAKYNVLDYSTAETLLHAVCAIGEWKKALRVLDDIIISSTPSHSAYSTLIGTLFKCNKEKEAMDIIQRSVADLRPLQCYAYNEWIEYYRRKYKTKGTIIKYLDKICWHISANSTLITKETADKIQNAYVSLGWKADFTKIRQDSGQCMSCNSSLDCLKISDEDFKLLQNDIKNKLIVGSDLFLKTSPKELSAFLKFVDATAPYDIVLDALNIAYAVRNGSHIQKMALLRTVVDHFDRKNKKILLLGRKHMLKWHKKTLEYLMRKTCSFFTEDISQDDPFFLTAAILSGPNTDIVSKDLLRGHRFILKDEKLKQIFQRWQWQHQWKVFVVRNTVIKPPLQYTPCAQKNDDGWHLPYEKINNDEKGFLHDGIPDSWLCLRSKVIR
ncbi:Mitochondrial ribonuclease P protein 3 [Papilio machaon]|uniref:Mitochondrial ribonuclease P catalytic subunit n=1 Tax=Papilio machaon TaxID=76193 RepID=A0A194QMK0_PAPMA|nr:Mitochondrial ribonuclease P protein 3 [Papilio machaon]